MAKEDPATPDKKAPDAPPPPPTPKAPAASDGQPAPIPPFLKTVWKLHPYILLAVSLVLAAVAYSLIPAKEEIQRIPLSHYFDGSLETVRRAKNPLAETTADNLWQDIIRAKTDVQYIFENLPYSDELLVDPRLLNPYLLFGECCWLYGRHPQITQNRRATFERAVWAYRRALAWEDKDWSERDQKFYDRQFFPEGEAFDEQVLEARKTLRRQYIEYMTALSALEAGQLNLAEEKLNGILQAARRADNPAPGARAEPQAGSLPPHEFELLPEDLTKLYFHLAQLCEKRGDLAEAERQYRIFLLHARRGGEYFQALLRLGNFSFQAGQKAEKEDPERARRQYFEAADIFSRIVADSPPGDILREAYFTGGRALFNMALTIPVGQETYWDKADALGGALRSRLESFSGGTLPARTGAILPAAARLLGMAGLASPSPLNACTVTAPGVLGELTAKDRLTRLGERARMLRRANAFFTGSQGGVDQKYDGASYVMLARIYLVQGEYEKARNLLRYTRNTLWSPEIADACQFEEAVSYLREGALDRSYVRFVGGVEKNADSLLIPDDIKSWAQFCVNLAQGVAAKEPTPAKQVWHFLSGDLQSVINQTAVSKNFPERFQLPLVKNLNAALCRENFYHPDNFQNLELPASGLELLKKNLPLLTLNDRKWLNRMLFDAAFRSTVMPTVEGVRLPPFPAADKIHESELLNRGMVIDVLTELSRRFATLAREENNPIPADADEPRQRLLAAAPRRCLEQASTLNRYLMDNYAPENSGEILLENAYLLARGAALAGSAPFRDAEQARELLAQSGLAFMAVSRDEHYLQLEEESLHEAGKNFFGAARYGQASEALSAFVRGYNKSDRIGWARNLLGRCYWYLGRYRDAIRVFRENASRHTPDGYESLYYLGAVYFDVRRTEDEKDDKVMVDRVGSPDDLYAPITADGRQESPRTALQVFNEIRRLQKLDPSARPWRWATFALGKVWYEIAERAREAETSAAAAARRRAVPVKWVPYYQTAEKILRESLDRYQLAENADETGTLLAKEPEDYEDIRRQRLESEYFLALTLRELHRDDNEPDETEVRTRLGNMINPAVYPNTMFAGFQDNNLLLRGDSLLGVTSGPVVRPRYLETLRRNAFFMLAQSWKQLGKRLEKSGQQKFNDAHAAYEEALKVYRRARDRLPPQDGPQIIYNIGDTLFDLGRYEDAGRMFLMAVSQVTQMESVEDRPEFTEEIRIWRTLAENRLRDLENLGTK